MRAVVVTDEAAGTAGVTLVERPEPLWRPLTSTSWANPSAIRVARALNIST